MSRQKAPRNLPKITRFLIDLGADINATIYVYGGYFYTIDLLKSNTPPIKASVRNEIMMILEEKR
ncbi:hypothetical protein [Aquimarina amphilecti]|uniref:hypothetical protein n=1 Tax=Aquimarina amphilecti TaxID=1038014 RepID=UPI000B86C91B|nr:hypothetical protein [Aquimarina amphilecti]